MNPNHLDLFPMDSRVLAMPEPQRLTLEYWLDIASRRCVTDNTGPEDYKYAYKCVREVRNQKIAEIIKSKWECEANSLEWNRHFHAYVTEYERTDWEERSGETAYSE
jgi:hypothetical protein